MLLGVLPRQGLLGRALLFGTSRFRGLQAGLWQPAGKHDLNFFRFSICLDEIQPSGSVVPHGGCAAEGGCRLC